MTYTHDTWNRLVKVESGSQTRAEYGYSYNGLNWRVVKLADTTLQPDGVLNQNRIMYYSANWQLLEEVIRDDWSVSGPNTEHDRRTEYVRGARYIDDIVLRREVPSATILNFFFPLQSARFSRFFRML